ncbi:MAG: hypothetical protein ABEI74_04025 [Candidatus Pacearchaeota archaeon]
MEKDIGKINKGDEKDIVLRVDDFGGRRGLTIREYITSDKYTGFTKAGVRISGQDFKKFKEMINSIPEEEIEAEAEGSEQGTGEGQSQSSRQSSGGSSDQGKLPDY